MSIKKIESWILRFPSNRFAAERSDEFYELIGVTVQDDSGETGTGWSFTSDWGGGEAVKVLIDTLLAVEVLGKEAHQTRLVTQALRHKTHRLGNGLCSLAIAAIDIALWDLHSRMQGVSLAAALGQTRDRVPAYGSGKASPSLPLRDLVATSVEYIDKGFDAIKLRVGRDVGSDIGRIGAVRKAVGDDVRILCDANERLSLPSAIWLGRQLQDQGVFWLEEPLYSGDLVAYRRLREALSIPIAAGEHVNSRQDLVNMASSGAIDIVQPDVCLIGGLTEALDVGRFAESLGLPVAPHFMTELHIHLAAALPSAEYVEYYPFLDDLLVDRLVVENGEIIVPQGPGHGVEFTRKAWSDYRVD